MATKKNLKDKVDKRYRAAVVVGKDGSGKEIKQWVSAKTKKELEEKKKAVLDRFISGYDVADMTVQDYIKLWLPGRIVGIKQSTLNGVMSAVNANILPVLGSRYITSVTMPDCAEVTHRMAKEGRNNVYIRFVLCEMKKIFASAYANGIIKRDPAHDLRAEKSFAKAGEKRALTAEESRIILDVGVNHPGGFILILMYYLGLRMGEAAGLKWQDIDFEDKVVHIVRQLDDKGLETTPKSLKGVRTVPLPDALCALLRGRRGVGYIVTTIAGTPMNAAYRLRRFCDLMELCAESVPSCSELTSHYLRHNYATLCYNAGVPVKTLQEWMGHSSITTTMNIYAHMDAERQKNAASLLKNVF